MCICNLYNVINQCYLNKQTKLKKTGKKKRKEGKLEESILRLKEK